ncbi:hemoglobin subunit alpha-like [Peromyscus maniculatus bairdii]|uniref:hemoglobin subunit alpha-like n=1 Tax=Peromyscus maniculatus bairdii TaxID=230844 RepID=UPI003FD0D8EF
MEDGTEAGSRESSLGMMKVFEASNPKPRTLFLSSLQHLVDLPSEHQQLEISVMASFPAMLFLTTLLLSSILTKGESLTQTQKESTTSAGYKANIKAVLDKIDCQGEENIVEALEKMLCASHQVDTSFGDLANADQNMLNLSTVLTSLRTCCAHKQQVEPANISSMAHRPEGPGSGDQQDDSTQKYVIMLDRFLDLVSKVLVSHGI